MKRVDDVWDNCPSGELQRLAVAIKRTHRLIFAGRLLAGVAILTALGTAVTLARSWIAW